MSVVQKLIDAQNNQDLKAYNEVVSKDYVWVKHSTGEEIPRDELSKWLISKDAPTTESSRIIYENNEIGVAHYFISFKDGSRKKRISSGSGADSATVNKLLKQFKMMTNMMKKMSKGDHKGGIPPEIFNQLK